MNSRSLDAPKITEELKKAVKATLLLMYPELSVLISGGTLSLTNLQPEGVGVKLTISAQLLPRAPKAEPPTEK